MGLKDCEKAFPIGHRRGNKKLNTVICIFQKQGYGNNSRINEMLENIQIELKKELTNYKQVLIAYVYEAPVLSVRPFQEFTKESPVYYQRPCEEEEVHDLAHLMFMGLALMKRLPEPLEDENRLYLLTDEDFDQMRIKMQLKELVFQDRKTGEVRIHPNFEDIPFRPFLYKSTEHAGTGIMERFFGKNVRVLDLEERRQK